MNKSSKLKIYQTAITPKKNMVVDDIDIYLSKLTPTIDIPDFQYQKIGLDIEIRVPADQSNVGNNALGNYVSIEQDDRVYYFFIMGAEWKNPMCVGLRLSIDTLNTFDKDLEWSPQTLIKRRHKDRFYATPIAENKSTHTKTFVRNIDKMKEGIQLPFVSQESMIIEQDNGEKTGLLDWYLIYQTRKDLKPDDIANPIDCYICASKDIPLRDDYRRKELEYHKNFLSADTSAYFTTNENTRGEIKIDGYPYEIGKKYKMIIDPSDDKTGETIVDYRTLLGVLIVKAEKDNGLYYSFLYDAPVCCYYVQDGKQGKTKPTTLSPAKPNERMTYANVIEINGTYYRLDKTVGDSVLFTQSDALEVSESGRFFAVTNLEGVKEVAKNIEPVRSGVKYIKSFKEVDRTDSKLMKIIKLPYSPTDFKSYYDEDYDRDFFVFDEDQWEYGPKDRLLHLLPNKLDVNLASVITEMDLTSIFTEDIQLNEWEREGIFSKFESKLYSSEFYICKFVYDSFAKDIALERIRAFYNLPSSVKDLKFPVEFKVTNTINSKMAFKFDIPLYDEVVDYEKFLIVNRNNEEPIYSNDYVNYIRNGYNYDKKSKDIADASAAFSFGTNLATSALSMVNPIVTSAQVMTELGSSQKNKGFRGSIGTLALSNAVSSTISMGASSLNSATSMISGIMDRENQMQGNLHNLSQQSTVVQGSDDVDLLSYYNKNKLEMKIYRPIEEYQNMLTTLFHYTGYADATRNFPKMHTRQEFDFIQCEAVFYNEETSSYADYLEDIKVRYAVGVTRFHNILPKEGGLWHFSQASENIELSILKAFEEDNEVEETPDLKPDINKPGVDFGKPDIPNITSADNGGNN